jgi:hypothetical protein
MFRVGKKSHKIEKNGLVDYRVFIIFNRYSVHLTVTEGRPCRACIGYIPRGT